MRLRSCLDLGGLDRCRDDHQHRRGGDSRTPNSPERHLRTHEGFPFANGEQLVRELLSGGTGRNPDAVRFLHPFVVNLPHLEQHNVTDLVGVECSVKLESGHGIAPVAQRHRDCTVLIVESSNERIHKNWRYLELGSERKSCLSGENNSGVLYIDKSHTRTKQALVRITGAHTPGSQKTFAITAGTLRDLLRCFPDFPPDIPQIFLRAHTMM